MIGATVRYAHIREHKSKLTAALAKGRYSDEFEQAQNDFYDLVQSERAIAKNDPAALAEISLAAKDAWSVVPPDEPACRDLPRPR